MSGQQPKKSKLSGRCFFQCVDGDCQFTTLYILKLIYKGKHGRDLTTITKTEYLLFKTLLTWHVT